MKKISRQEVRDKTVGSILGTLRIEQLQPSAEVIAGMKEIEMREVGWGFSLKDRKDDAGLLRGYSISNAKPASKLRELSREMGTAYKNRRGSNLYQFWQQDITQHLNNILQGEPLINLASNEYFKAVAKSKLNSDIITPVFKDQKNGQFKIISFFAKKARGLMARYIIEHDITLPHELQQFDVAGYYFCAQESNANTYVFKRDEK